MLIFARGPFIRSWQDTFASGEQVAGDPEAPGKGQEKLSSEKTPKTPVEGVLVSLWPWPEHP